MKQKNTLRTLMFLLCLPLALFAFVGCDDDSDVEDAAESAGENMENAAEDTGDAVQDATN